MTMPDERKRAVLRAEEFLHRIADPRRSKRIPREIREEACLVARHYPTALDLEGWDGAPMYDFRDTGAEAPPDHPNSNQETPTYGNNDTLKGYSGGEDPTGEESP